MADESAFLSAYCKVPCLLKDAFDTSLQIINYIRRKDSITNIVTGITIVLIWPVSHTKLKVCHR